MIYIKRDIYLTIKTLGRGVGDTTHAFGEPGFPNKKMN
jgi:hypothetical protein